MERANITSYSLTRWWSRFEVHVLEPVFLLFGDVQPFLQVNDDLGPACMQKILSIFQDQQKAAILKIKLAALVDWDKAFVQGTYNLEGDRALVFRCYVGSNFSSLDSGG